MAWKAFIKGAEETERGARVQVEFRDFAADGVTIEQTREQSYFFGPSEPLTRASLKAKVMPDLQVMNNQENAVAQINLNVGTDISTL